MNVNFSRMLMMAAASIVLMSAPVWAAETAEPSDVHHLSGEIIKIDTKLGLLQFKSDMSRDKGEVNEYKINTNETRVTDPLDKKFLTIEDLQMGQYVIIDVAKGERNKALKKIVAYPYLAPGLQQAFGNIQSIDNAAGTLVLAERPMANDMRKDHMSSFVFEPRNIIIMQDPNTQPVQMILVPGDLISVVYVTEGGKNHAQTITAYAPAVTQTTVTTTRTTTRKTQ